MNLKVVEIRKNQEYKMEVKLTPWSLYSCTGVIICVGDIPIDLHATL